MSFQQYQFAKKRKNITDRPSKHHFGNFLGAMAGVSQIRERYASDDVWVKLHRASSEANSNNSY